MKRVAPYTGAWIETKQRLYIYNQLRSHPIRVRGLKLQNGDKYFGSYCRTLYGCVDWNYAVAESEPAETGRTLYGCVDWNKATPTLRVT